MKRHVLVGLMALSMACSGPTAPDHEPMVGVQISCDGCFTGYPVGDPFLVGQSRSFFARVGYWEPSSFMVVSCADFTWTSSTPAVATPSGNGSIGRVTAVAAGTFTLTVVAECGSHGRVTGSFPNIEIFAQGS